MRAMVLLASVLAFGTLGRVEASEKAAAVARHNRAGEKVWNRIKQRGAAVQKHGGVVEYEHQAANGTWERAGFYMSGKQVQIETPGQKGAQLHRVMNFGVDAALHDTSVTYSVGGDSLMIIRRPGQPVARKIALARGRFEDVSRDDVKAFLAKHGKFKPAP